MFFQALCVWHMFLRAVFPVVLKWGIHWPDAWLLSNHSKYQMSASWATAILLPLPSNWAKWSQCHSARKWGQSHLRPDRRMGINEWRINVKIGRTTDDRLEPFTYLSLTRPGRYSEKGHGRSQASNTVLTTSQKVSALSVSGFEEAGHSRETPLPPLHLPLNKVHPFLYNEQYRGTGTRQVSVPALWTHICTKNNLKKKIFFC